MANPILSVAGVTRWLQRDPAWKQPGRPGRWVHDSGCILETQFVRGEATYLMTGPAPDRTSVRLRGPEARVTNELIDLIDSLSV